MNSADWRSWPDAQQQAVLQFFNAAFRAGIETHPEEQLSAVDWLCGLVHLGEPPLPLMEDWNSSGSVNAALQMADFIKRESKHLARRGVVKGPFWEDADEKARAEIGAWLRSDRTQRFVASVAEQVSEEDRFLYIDAALSELTRPF